MKMYIYTHYVTMIRILLDDIFYRDHFCNAVYVLLTRSSEITQRNDEKKEEDDKSIPNQEKERAIYIKYKIYTTRYKMMRHI